MNEIDPFQRARSVALRLLTYRPRTEAEVRDRLRRRFDAAVSEQVVQQLKERLLLDDAQFARRWAESRNSRSPRSKAAIRREIVSRGVDRTVADRAVSDLDDDSSAYRAGVKHARRLGQTDLKTFYRRMWGYLRRRGYSGSVARNTVHRIWAESRGQATSLPEKSTRGGNVGP